MPPDQPSPKTRLAPAGPHAWPEGNRRDRDFAEWYQYQENALEAWRKNFLVRRIVTLARSYVLGGGVTISSDHAYLQSFAAAFAAHPENRLAERTRSRISVYGPGEAVSAHSLDIKPVTPPPAASSFAWPWPPAPTPPSYRGHGEPTHHAPPPASTPTARPGGPACWHGTGTAAGTADIIHQSDPVGETGSTKGQ